MRSTFLLAAVLALAAAPLRAQRSAPLAVGEAAPAFAGRAATAAGVVPKPFRLQEVKARTVVLAFFYKARTSG